MLIKKSLGAKVRIFIPWDDFESIEKTDIFAF